MKLLLLASLIAASTIAGEQPKTNPYVQLNVGVPSRYVMLIGPNGAGRTVQPSINIGATNVLKKEDDLSVTVWHNFDVPKSHFNEQDFDLTYKLPKKKTRLGDIVGEGGGGHFNYGRVDFGNHDHYSRAKITLENKISTSIEYFHLFPNGQNNHGDLLRLEFAKQFKLPKKFYARPSTLLTFGNQVYGSTGFLTKKFGGSIGWSKGKLNVEYQGHQFVDRRPNTTNLFYHGPSISWRF